MSGGGWAGKHRRELLGGAAVLGSIALMQPELLGLAAGGDAVAGAAGTSALTDALATGGAAGGAGAVEGGTAAQLADLATSTSGTQQGLLGITEAPSFSIGSTPGAGSAFGPLNAFGPASPSSLGAQFAQVAPQTVPELGGTEGLGMYGTGGYAGGAEPLNLAKAGKLANAFGKSAYLAKSLGAGQEPPSVRPPAPPGGSGMQVVPTAQLFAQTYAPVSGVPGRASLIGGAADDERKRRLLALLAQQQGLA